MANRFQVNLGGEWRDYPPRENRLLVNAYLAGMPHAKFRLGPVVYQVNFNRPMEQLNLMTGKAREMRPPYKLKPPARPVVPAGPTRFVTVPREHQGMSLLLTDPDGRTCAVQLDRAPKPGQTVAIPMGATARRARSPQPPSPPGPSPRARSSRALSPRAPSPRARPSHAPSPRGASPRPSGPSTGAAVAAAGAGAVAAGGLVAAGVVLGETTDIADWAADAGADLADWAEPALEDAATWVEGAAEDAGTWLSDAAKDTSNVLMDIF